MNQHMADNTGDTKLLKKNQQTGASDARGAIMSMKRPSKTPSNNKSGRQEVLLSKKNKAPPALAPGSNPNQPPSYGWTPSGNEIVHEPNYLSGAV